MEENCIQNNQREIDILLLQRCKGDEIEKEEISELIEKGASPFVKDEEGDCIYHLITKERIDLIKILLKEIQPNFEEIKNYMIHLPNSRDEGDSLRLFYHLLPKRPNENSKNAEIELLNYAITLLPKFKIESLPNEFTKIVYLLLSHGIDLNEKGDNLYPLDLVEDNSLLFFFLFYLGARKCNPIIGIKCATLFLVENIVSLTKSKEENTIYFLIEKGADISQLYDVEEKESMFEFLCLNFDKKMIEICLKNGRNLFEDHLRTTNALDIVLAKGFLEEIQLILQYISSNRIDLDLSDYFYEYCKYSKTINIDILSLFFLYGCSPNKIVSENQNAFHVICSRGSIEMIDLFLKKGADINLFCISSKTPLELLCETRKANILEQVIDLCKQYQIGLDYNCQLYFYCSTNQSLNLEVIRIWVEGGSNLNSYQYNGDTSFRHICSKGEFEVLKYSLEKGGNLKDSLGGISNYNIICKKKNNQTIHYATLFALKNNIELDFQSALLFYCKYRETVKKEMLRIFVENGANLNTKINKSEDSPFHYISLLKQQGLTKFCLEELNADITLASTLGIHLSPFENICKVCDEDTILYCLSFIKQNNLNVDYTKSFLLYCKFNEISLKIVTKFIENGANLNKQVFSNDDSAFHYICLNSLNVIVNYCLDSGGSLSNRCYSEASPFSIVCKYKSSSMIKLLLNYAFKKGRSINLEEGLIFYLQNINIDFKVISLFLYFGVNPNVQFNLKDICITEYTSILEYFLCAGIETNQVKIFCLFFYFLFIWKK